MANPYNPQENYAGYGPAIEEEGESLGIINTINPLAGLTSDPFLYYYGLRIGAMGHQMSGLLSSERAFARNLRIPIGFKSLTYGGSFEKAKTAITKYESDYARGLAGEALRERNNRLAKSLLGGKPRKGFAKMLTEKPGFKVSPVAKGMGFFAGYSIGQAAGLGEVGSIGAGLAGVGIMSRTGGVAKFLYERGHRDSARVAAELSVQPTTRIGRAFTDLAFGISGESLNELGMGRGVREGVFEKLYGREGIYEKKFGAAFTAGATPTQTNFIMSGHKNKAFRRIQSKRVQSFAEQAIVRQKLDNQSERLIYDVIRANERELPLNVLGLTDDSVNAVMGKELNATLRQHMFKRQAFPLLGRLFPWRRAALDESIEQNVKKSIRNIIDKEARIGFVSKEGQEALTKMGVKSETLRTYMSRLSGGAVDVDELTDYIYKKGQFAEKTKAVQRLAQRKLTRQALVGFAGKAIGFATTASLVVHATTAGLRYSMSAMEAVGGMLSEMRHPEFGSGRYTDTPQATTERQLAFNSIQNALGMGRALMGNEAAMVH